MAAITIELSEDQLRKLKAAASSLGVAPEELVSASIDDLVGGSNVGDGSTLLETIEQRLSPEDEKRYAELNTKRWEETLTPDEHSELLRLNEKVEELQVQRIRLLIELARLQKTSLTTLIDSLGIRPRAL